MYWYKNLETSEEVSPKFRRLEDLKKWGKIRSRDKIFTGNITLYGEDIYVIPCTDNIVF